MPASKARHRENAFLFHNFEAVLPNCRECYVPAAAEERAVAALSAEIERVSPSEAKQMVDQSGALILDVTRNGDVDRIKGALRANPNDLTGWLNVLPRGKDVVTYCT